MKFIKNLYYLISGFITFAITKKNSEKSKFVFKNSLARFESLYTQITRVLFTRDLQFNKIFVHSLQKNLIKNCRKIPENLKNLK